MSGDYARDMLKVSFAKMLQTIGWNSIHTIPLEILTDIGTQYIMQIAKYSHDFANEFGCTEPNLDHLGLAFRECHVNLSELEEYVTYVNFGQPPTPLPKFPIPKEDNLNFLKPGSKEVVTRQVHIHEHLPPMFQINDANENEIEPSQPEIKEELANVDSASQVFKKPAEISPGESFKRPRLLMEEEGRPTREISSVMMTTSGYISPAREGKLPESRTPLGTIDSISNSNTPPANNTSNGIKPNKMFKKMDKKKDKIGKELFKPLPDAKPPKKATTMKDIVKMKQKEQQASIANGQLPPVNNFVVNNEVKVPPPTPPPPAPVVNSQTKPAPTNKVNKALAAARLKTEKFNTTITPIPMKPPPVQPPPETNIVDKLFTEPDKKKVNILKKISNVKNEKVESKPVKLKEEIKQESRESSPNLIIDEPPPPLPPPPPEPNSKMHISNDITIELIDATPKKEDKHEKSYFDDDSPPGTPSTPKTPEMISQSPPVVKEKKKRKDKSKIKKVPKFNTSPATMEYEMEVDRPKTPEAHVFLPPQPPQNNLLPPAFPLFPQFPGLIPSNPLFNNLSLFGIGGNPCIPPVQFMPPIKHEEPRPKSPAVSKQPSTSTGPSTSSHAPPSVQQLQKQAPPLPPVQQLPPQPQPQPQPEPALPSSSLTKAEKKNKKDKKDKIKKKNKKDKIKSKAEKKKLKEEKKDKEKIKKEKKEKRKEKEVHENLEVTIPKLTLKLGTPSPRPDTPDTKKLNIKPVVKKEEEEEKPKEPEVKRELSPELAKISALVTGQPKPKLNPPPAPSVAKEDIKEDSAAVPAQRIHPGPGRPRIHPIKQKTLKPNKRQVPVKDSEGNEVWICPGCGRQDDGSPMIGCDDCDAWYHWVCVGIQVPPDDNEDWYCRLCIVKKQEVLQSDKKKKRKKREKKEH